MFDQNSHYAVQSSGENSDREEFDRGDVFFVNSLFHHVEYTVYQYGIDWIVRNATNLLLKSSAFA